MLEKNDKNQKVLEDIEWQSLDEVIRRWAAQSGFEKDMSNYQKMKELYQ